MARAKTQEAAKAEPGAKASAPGKRVGMEVSIAVSHAVQMARAEAIAAYPITPQTHIVEHMSSMVANGELEAEFINVESEHSAMSACIGMSASGARTYTATSSQGLALMFEILFIASAMRFPIVMTVANRALSGPLNIWNDHGDIMAARDIGWIQIFVENGQESYDHTIMAFKIAENHKVLLPTVINMDGFILTHVVEALEFLEQEQVDKFLPSYHPRFTMDPKRPVTMGAFAMPEMFTEVKFAHQVALTNAYDHILKVWKEYGDLSGRYYQPVERYKTEGAKVLLLLMGSLAEVAEIAVDELRGAKEKVGLLKLRLWRPFPFQDLRDAVEGADLVIVLDRALSLGGAAGPVLAEVRSALYPLAKKPAVLGYTVGLGGRDIQPETFKDIVRLAQEELDQGPQQEFHIFGVRG
jgi:pyruvate ferredoxin oxidoreductase alpha subunit